MSDDINLNKRSRIAGAIVLLRTRPMNVFLHFYKMGIRKAADAPYELRYGISTSRETRASEDPVRQIVRYEPTPYVTLRAIRKHIQTHASGVRCFVDIGCGLGRPLYYFAPLFDELIGFELSEQLFRSADDQLKRVQKRSRIFCRISLLLADATSALPLDRELVLFLYNPFGPEPMMRLCQHISRSAHTIHLYYVNPKQGGLVEEWFGPPAERFTNMVDVAYFRIVPDARASTP